MIWFPTAKGVVMVDSANITTNLVPPKIQIQSVRANGKVVNASGRFEATWVRGPRGQWFIDHMVTRPNRS